MNQKKRPRTDGPWYGVKTLYRSTAVGRPTATDAAYDPVATLVEERVVLLKARSLQDAIRAGEREARAYVSSQHINPYGQKVTTRYLGAAEAYHLFYPPGPGVEVFSSTRIVARSVRDTTVVNHRMGAIESSRTAKRRKKFLNRELSGEVRRGV